MTTFCIHHGLMHNSCIMLNEFTTGNWFLWTKISGNVVVLTICCLGLGEGSFN